MAEENQTRRRDDMHPDVPLQWEGESAQAEQPLWDDNGEPWNEAAEKAERARLASQLQAAQPTAGLLEAYERVREEFELAITLGGQFDTDSAMLTVDALLRAHIAGTSQATKAQAEPVDQGHVLRTLRSLLDGSQPKDIAGAVAVIDHALKTGIAWSYDIVPPSGFISYVKANYTGDVHFHDPEWHAARLWNAAMKNVGARLAAPVAKEAPAVPELTVWYGPMPESNGASNFTATLMRKGASMFDTDSYTFSRSEYPDRVRYEADFMSYLIGERAERPEMWDKGYDFDKHSGYVAPTTSTVSAPIPSAIREAVEAAFEERAGWRAKIAAAVRALDSAQAAPEEVCNAAINNVLDLAYKGLRDWETPDNRYRALEAIDKFRALRTTSTDTGSAA